MLPVLQELAEKRQSDLGVNLLHPWDLDVDPAGRKALRPFQGSEELTEKTLMDKVAVNRACKVLEARELAARIPNERDGRSHHLELTNAGAEMHAKIVPMAREIEASLLAPMSDDQQAMFRDLLDQVRKQAE